MFIIFSRNLILVSRLVPFGFHFNFRIQVPRYQINLKLLIMVHCLMDFFPITLQNNVIYDAMNVTAGLKHCVVKENSLL